MHTDMDLYRQDIVRQMVPIENKNVSITKYK